MLHKNFVIALQFADAFVVSPVQLLQLLRLVSQQLLPPLELPLRPLVVCLAVVLVRNRRGNYQIFIFLSHSFSISFISLCAYDTAPAPSGGLFFGAPTPGMFITDAFTSVSSTLSILILTYRAQLQHLDNLHRLLHSEQLRRQVVCLEVYPVRTSLDFHLFFCCIGFILMVFISSIDREIVYTCSPRADWWFVWVCSR